MEFKIRHFQSWIDIISAICVFLCFASPLLIITAGFPKWFILAVIAVMFFSIILRFAELIIGTKININDNTITINYLFHKDVISAEEISSLEEKTYYSRMYRSYIMEMTITLCDKRKIVLYDKAQKSGISLGLPEKLSGNDIPLYRAYVTINSMKNSCNKF